ncbi:MAG: hypothetical protein WC829_17280 [Hyphomicrobium sp.]|jgi:hypothetical protein
MTTRLSKLCIALARESRSLSRTPDEIVKDAAALLNAGDAARDALANERPADMAFARATEIARLYEARVVERGDLEGTVLGLKFRSPHYANGTDRTYCVA